MDFVSRLKLYLETRRISVTQFADECRIPRPTASQLLAGRNKKVSDEMIGKIHQCYPDVSVVWLMFGEGDMLNPGSRITPQPAEQADGKENMPSEAHAPEERAYYGSREQGHGWESGGFANQDREGAAPQQYDFANINRSNRDNSFANSPAEITDANPAKPNKPREFAFTTQNDKPEQPSQPLDMTQNSTEKMPTSKMGIKQFVIPSVKGKRVAGIVVYYDDHTFESFIPEEHGGRSFMI